MYIHPKIIYVSLYESLIFYNKFITSSKYGIEGIAPGRETAIDEALAAIRIASSLQYPRIIAARKYPVNVSPAAVVSCASAVSYTHLTLPTKA